jgi:hypothetical protein
MHINDFIKLDLKIGDYIWMMNESGEGIPGNYDGNFNQSNSTFQFRNHSNGKTQVINIEKLQRLELNSRA